jgi:RhoGAP domain
LLCPFPPQVNVSDTVIHLKDVVYGLPLSKTITIENVGNVAATWRFIPKPEEMHFCKTWLSCEPAYGMIVPGDKATITMTVMVDDAVARDISLGRELAFPSLTSGAAATSMAPSTSAAQGGLLEDILILRMERGRDYYLSVSASVLPTCFGCSLSQLARRPEPMRALSLTAAATSAINSAAGIALGQSPMTAGGPGASPTTGSSVREIRAPVDLAAGSHTLSTLVGGDEEELTPGAAIGRGLSGVATTGMDLMSSSIAALNTGANLLSLSSSDITRKGSQLMSVPKEIWRLVDAIWNRGMETRGLFLAPGNPADVIEVREALDTGDAIPNTCDPVSIAQVLCDLLESLREPVIPVIYFPLSSDLKSMGVDGWTAQMLRNIAPLHYNVLVYLVRFGREVLAHGHANGCSSVEDLAYVLSRCMMRRIPHDEAPAHIEPAASSSAGGASGAGAAEGGGGVFGGGGGKGGGGGGANDEANEEGAAIAKLSLYADKGTRWEPTKEEQDNMTKIFVYLLTVAPLA